MIRYANIEFLYALWLIPLLILIYWYTRRRQIKLLDRFATPELQNIIVPMKSKFKSPLKFGIFITSLSLLLITLANPQVGTKIEEVKQVGIDVYILLDVSKSMLAEDIKPSRLEKAKYEISRLIQRLRGDRIGLIVFAGKAYVQIPLTTDYSAANLFLSAVDVNTVPQPGTAIGPAIDLALNSFRYDEGTKKAIVIITDGEDHEGDIEKAIEDAKSKDVVIYAIGFGSPAGVPIPIYNQAGSVTGFMKDREGNIVLTKLDETILKTIAEGTNGKYYRGTNTQDELENIYNDLAKIEKSEYGSKKITEYEDRYYYFLFTALFLLIIEFLISLNKSKLMMRFEALRKVEQ